MIEIYVRNPISKTIMKILMVLIALIAIFPIIWMMLNAFKTRVDILSIPPKWIFTPTLMNFKEIFHQRDFVKGFLNSTIICFVSVGIAMILGVPAAYGLCRFRFKAKDQLAFWILSARFSPPIFVLVPFFLMFKLLGLTDTKLGLILIYLIISLPLVIWLMYSFFKDVPIELEEAAMVDGANPFYVFYKISLPLVSPGLVAASILALVFSWNELLFAVVLAGPNTRTLPVTISSFASYLEIIWGSMSAASMIAALPVIIFTLLIQKYLVSGLTLGAVKG